MDYTSSTGLHRIRTSYTLTLKICDFPNSAFTVQTPRAAEETYTPVKPLQKFTFTRVRFEPHSNREVGRPRITTVRKTCVGGQARGGGPGSCTPPPRPDTGPPAPGAPRPPIGGRDRLPALRVAAQPMRPAPGTSDPAFHPGLPTPQSAL